MPNYPTQNLQPGMRSPAVKQLQDYLVSIGYMTRAEVNTGPGVYGPKTTAAVNKLQQNLGVDNSSGPGYWGPRTISAVQKQGQPSPSSQPPTPAIQQPDQRQQEIEKIKAEVLAKQGLLQQAQQMGYANQDIQVDSNTGKVLPPSSQPTPQQPQASVLPPEYDTGNKEMNEVLTEMKKLLDQNLAAGKVVNPKIELTPSEIQAFLDQAEKEINPYYASQITSIKDDLFKNIENLQKQYQLEKEGAAEEFKQSLEQSRESAAGRGLTFSGSRIKQERGFAESTQRKLDLDALQKEASIGSSLRSIESKIGTSALPSLPTFEAPKVTLEGFTPGRKLSFGQSGDIFGTLPSQRLVDIRKRKNELETSKRQSRVLDFYST